jgi:hypothetical protein
MMSRGASVERGVCAFSLASVGCCPIKEVIECGSSTSPQFLAVGLDRAELQSELQEPKNDVESWHSFCSATRTKS